MRAKALERVIVPGLGLLLLVPACGGGGGGESSGGGTDGGGGDTGGGDDGGGDDGADDESGEVPDEDQPDEHGDQCGNDVNGWQTGCKVQDATASANDKGEIAGAPQDGDATSGRLCCEGRPSTATADGGCTALCLREICEAAKLEHMNRCNSCGIFDCGFDMSNCLAGGAHIQTVTCATPLMIPYSYTLTASCTAFNNEARNPDGSFHFIQYPNQGFDDPLRCMSNDGSGIAPPSGLGQYKGSESEGTVAGVTWSMAEASGMEQSEDLRVRLEYAMLPCGAPAGECMQLTTLELTLPTTEALGMTITNARLSVISVAEAPAMERGGRFQLSDRSLRVLMQAHVDGFPLVLSGWNTGTPRGRLSPAGDQLSLTGLRFEFEDSVVTAALEIDIQGQYDARRPNAQITHTTAPKSCTEPVTLLATSWDDDDEPLTHSWWIRDVGTFSGPLVEVVLPAGLHDVMLTSFDPAGLFDTTTLRYDRACQ